MKYTELTDESLIKTYLQGEESALAVLVERHHTELYNFIFYKVKDREVAGDLMQDTFVKIIQTLKKGGYREDGKFLLWAKRIAYNMTIDYFREQSKKYKNFISLYDEDDNPAWDRIPDTTPDAEHFLMQQETLSKLEQLLVGLPPKQQEILAMRYFDGLSFREISDATGTGINTALGRVRYALLNLRKQIDQNNLQHMMQ